VERTHRAALHLKTLIDDVLDLAKLESGTLELDLAQTTIRPLVAELMDTLAPLAAEHGSALVSEIDDAPEFFTTDPRAVRQVLYNLLTNAIKFGAARPVRLRCTRRDDRVVFEVIDRGIGVPPGEIERIFDDFVQLKPADQEGTGLGLSIARQLTERLGGRLDVESTPGAGSTFRLTLPTTGPADA
jgi:signal transduction histidine kinase